MQRTFILLLLLASPLTQAHDSRPNYVQIAEIETNTFSVTWQVPDSLPSGALPNPTLPDNCSPERKPALQRSAAGYVGRQVYRCPEPLSGRTVGIEFPVINPSLSTLYEIRLATGDEHVRILKPGETKWTVPEAEDRFAVASEYTRLGIEHIWAGLDHLLFVACLLLIANTSRQLLITVTGFTVAHSITLALSALNLVRVPTPPVEAVIALSVVFLACEIAKGDERSLTHHHPIVVSSSFGLLHGFGFATVLRDIGLPQTELLTALLFFNVGVEIGQILFVLALLIGFYAVRPVLLRLLRSGKNRNVYWSSLTVPASYAIGSIASFWMIERVLNFGA